MSTLIKELRNTHPRDSGYAETANRAADQIEALVKALTELSNMYAHTWDRVDGAMVMFDKGIERFERAHHEAQVALATVNETPLPAWDDDEDPTPQSPDPVSTPSGGE